MFYYIQKKLKDDKTITKIIKPSQLYYKQVKIFIHNLFLKV